MAEGRDTPIAAKALDITLTSGVDLAALGPRWRALEARADGSFFQSWTWLGCLVQERFTNPVLLAARQDGRDVALALFNQGRRFTGRTLWLGETGVPALDAVYVEHNGILFERGREDVLAPCLAALLRPRWGRRVVMSGVDEAHLAAARASGGAVRVIKTQPSPFVDFSKLPPGEDGFLRSLSANTRYQLRRSARSYETAGPLAVTRAATIEKALGVLDDLERLHQATWVGRGQPGAFAAPGFRRFHLALIAEGLPRGEIDLLRVCAGGRLVGCLYNFRYGGSVLAYQSGFDYEQTSVNEKPGLTAHKVAIELAEKLNARSYDLLAGEGRYKSSLANAYKDLHWIEISTLCSLRRMFYLILRSDLRLCH